MPGKFRYSFPHASIIDPGDELVGSLGRRFVPAAPGHAFRHALVPDGSCPPGRPLWSRRQPQFAQGLQKPSRIDHKQKQNRDQPAFETPTQRRPGDRASGVAGSRQQIAYSGDATNAAKPPTIGGCDCPRSPPGIAGDPRHNSRSTPARMTPWRLRTTITRLQPVRAGNDAPGVGSNVTQP